MALITDRELGVLPNAGFFIGLPASSNIITFDETFRLWELCIAT